MVGSSTPRETLNALIACAIGSVGLYGGSAALYFSGEVQRSTGLRLLAISLGVLSVVFALGVYLTYKALDEWVTAVGNDWLVKPKGRP